MNSHFGICETCGFSTSVDKYGHRKCPNGHGGLLMLDHRYAKLINKKGDTGKDRLRKLKLFMEQVEFNNNIQIRKVQMIGTGKQFSWKEFFTPYRAKIK